MKVRIGYGLGTRTTLHDERFGHVVDELERLSFDSLWVSERIGADAPDPIVALAFGAGRTTHLEIRNERDGAAGPQPDRARQGTRQPGDALRRPAASGVRARRGASARAAGLRRRTLRAGPLVRRVDGRDAVVLDRRTESSTSEASDLVESSNCSRPWPRSSRRRNSNGSRSAGLAAVDALGVPRGLSSESRDSTSSRSAPRTSPTLERAFDDLNTTYRMLELPDGTLVGDRLGPIRGALADPAGSERRTQGHGRRRRARVRGVGRAPGRDPLAQLVPR